MNAVPYEFHPEAQAEVEESARWYADRDLETSGRFYDEVAAAIDGVTTLPDTWPPYLHGTRRYLLDRFPYALIYREKDGVIQLVALAHHRRRPGYWSDRIE